MLLRKDLEAKNIKPKRFYWSTVSRTVVYALGGNTLQSGTDESIEESSLVLAKVMSDVVDLLEGGWRVVITHGNGPQVGHLLALDQSVGLDFWVSATQGMIGHQLSLNLDSILLGRGRPERTAIIVTRVEVDSTDPGFESPTKPVGPILSDDDVMSKNWDIAQTAQGPRRVVASPLPMRILDLDVIKALVDQRAIVICGGGGGIPVVKKDDHFIGVPAVVDKDRLSALLAIKLQADALIITTAVDSIRTNFGGEDEQIHSQLTVDEVIKYMAEGQFPIGSMGPKVSSLVEAVVHVPGLKSLLCQPGDALGALRGEKGTRIVL